MSDFRTLTLTNVADTKEENTQVTFSPADIRVVSVFSEVPVMLQNEEYKRVVVIFNDGLTFTGHFNDYDINVLETTVGGFGFPE